MINVRTTLSNSCDTILRVIDFIRDGAQRIKRPWIVEIAQLNDNRCEYSLIGRE